MKYIDTDWLHKNISHFKSQKCVVLTGAGLSVPSGVPDFRSKTGLFATHTRTLFDFNYSQSKDSRPDYLKFVAEMKRIVESAEPCDSHKGLLLLRNRNKTRVYSQNIDGLEKKVGLRHNRKMTSELVLLHGNLEFLQCSVCKVEVVFGKEHLEKFKDGEEVECLACVENSRRVEEIRNGSRIEKYDKAEVVNKVKSRKKDKIKDNDKNKANIKTTETGSSNNITKAVDDKVMSLNNNTKTVEIENKSPCSNLILTSVKNKIIINNKEEGENVTINKEVVVNETIKITDENLENTKTKEKFKKKVLRANKGVEIKITKNEYVSVTTEVGKKEDVKENDILKENTDNCGVKVDKDIKNMIKNNKKEIKKSNEEKEDKKTRNVKNKPLKNENSILKYVSTRTKPIGRLNTSIIHYNQSHPDDEFIGEYTIRDSDLTLFIVIGTSLKVNGCKKLTKHFLKNLNGLSLFVNMEEPSGEFSDAFDFMWKGSCVDFFNSLKLAYVESGKNKTISIKNKIKLDDKNTVGHKKSIEKLKTECVELECGDESLIKKKGVGYWANRKPKKN